MNGPATVADIVIEPLLTPQAEVLFAVAVITGNGLTVIVYVDGVPAQPFTLGVTVIVDVTGDDVALAAVKLCTFPVPLASERPIVVLELVQLKVAPEGALVKLDDGTVSPEHMVIFAGTVTVASGFTVML